MPNWVTCWELIRCFLICQLSWITAPPPEFCLFSPLNRHNRKMNNNLAQMSGEQKRTFRDSSQRGASGKGAIPTMVNQTGLEEDSDDSDKPAKRSGRRKIKIEYIEDKNRRHITFSKRKAGIMKKVNISISI